MLKNLNAQEPPPVNILARGTTRRACRASIVLLAAAFFLGALVPVESGAVSAKKQCIKERCKQPKKNCIQGFVEKYEAAKAACASVGPKKVVRACKRAERNAFGQDKRACKAAYKGSCKLCCAGEVTTSCDVQVCGDGIKEVGEECDGGDDSACPGACRADCTCGSAPCPGDLDCDGLLDTEEAAGWEVTVTQADGTQNTFVCTSSPTASDTDADGLLDAEERMVRTDPRRADTDSDGLNDRTEIYVYKSDPCMVDSDGDSRGPNGDQPTDPNLWDGTELLLSKTSPVLDDTDGDGYTDWEEIHGGGTSPRIADLPELDLRLYTDPELVLNITATDGTKYIASELEQNSSEYQRTDTVSTRMAIENTIQIHTEVEVGTSQWPPSASAKMTTDTKFEHSYVNETSSSWTKNSVNMSKNEYNTVKDRVTQYHNGIIKVGMKILNNSNIAVTLGDPRVVATRFTPGGSFRSVGTLEPGDMVIDPGTGQQSWVPDTGTWEMEMGPGGEIVMEIGDGAVPAQIMEALIRDPTALMFEIGSYSLVSADGKRNYVEVGEDVVGRTGVIVIDFGDGIVERYAVATNVYRNADGSGAGVTLGDALGEIIGIDYETRPGEQWQNNCQERVPTGRTSLYRVRSHSAYGDCGDHHQGFWFVGGNGVAFDGDLGDFDDIVIHNGDRVTLAWVEDTDGDGVFDREEYLLGTDDQKTDTDGDGLDDYDESRVGWDVVIEGNDAYRVYPDPRFEDIDGDQMWDAEERNDGTDPYLDDTDGDGDSDQLDPEPLRPYCLEGAQLLLTAWIDGSTEVSGASLAAKDVWTADQHASNGLLSSPGVSINQGENEIFRFVNLQEAKDFIEIPSDGSISPTQEYTISAMLNFAGVGGGQDWGLVLAKGAASAPNYALFVSKDGALMHVLYRHFKTKCTQCSIFGCCDGCCADDSGNGSVTQQTVAGVIPRNEWVHVVVTYALHHMTIYIDGQPLSGAQVDVWVDSAEVGGATGTWTQHYWKSGLNHRTRYTEYLIANGAPLRIGGMPGFPYRGLIDEVQVFNRAFNAGEVENLHSFGTCAPGG